MSVAEVQKPRDIREVAGVPLCRICGQPELDRSGNTTHPQGWHSFQPSSILLTGTAESKPPTPPQPEESAPPSPPEGKVLREAPVPLDPTVGQSDSTD